MNPSSAKVALVEAELYETNQAQRDRRGERAGAGYSQAGATRAGVVRGVWSPFAYGDR